MPPKHRPSSHDGMVWDGGVSIGNFTPNPKPTERRSMSECNTDPRLSSILIPRDQILGRSHMDPEEMFLRRLAGQVDFLFSDSNLWTSQDMKNEISANDAGWVSLSFIARLPRVAVLTRERDVILAALKYSWFLEVDANGTMIRRPVSHAYNPENNPRRHAKKSMYVDSLPEELCDEESVRKLFEMFGTVTNVLMCQPWMPLDQQDSSTAREWSLLNSDCRNRKRDVAFFVDYENKNHAKSAVTAVSVFNRKLQEGRIESGQQQRPSFLDTMGETTISIRPYRGRIDSLASEYISTPSMSPMFAASMTPNGLMAQSPLMLQSVPQGQVPSLSLTSVSRASIHDSPKKVQFGRFSPKKGLIDPASDTPASPASGISTSSDGADEGENGKKKSAFRLSACSPVFVPMGMTDDDDKDAKVDSEYENLSADFEGLYVMTKFSYMKRMERMYVPGAPGQSPGFGPNNARKSSMSPSLMGKSPISLSMSPSLMGKAHMSPSLMALGSAQAHQHSSRPSSAKQSPKLVAVEQPPTSSRSPDNSKKGQGQGRRSRSNSTKGDNNNSNSPEQGRRERSDSKGGRERSNSKSGRDRSDSKTEARSDNRNWRDSPAMQPSPSMGPSTPSLKLTAAAIPTGKPPRSGDRKKKKKHDGEDGSSSPEGGSSPPGGGSALGILRSMRKHSKSMDSDDGQTNTPDKRGSNASPNDKRGDRSGSGKKKGRNSRNNTPRQSPKLGPTDPSTVRPKRASELQKTSLRFAKGPVENSKGFGAAAGGFGRGKKIE